MLLLRAMWLIRKEGKSKAVLNVLDTKWVGILQQWLPREGFVLRRFRLS